MPAAVVRPRKLVPVTIAGARSALRPAPARPFLKWAGGKKQLRAAFAPLFPPADQVVGYHEPFLGSGAVFFDVKSRLAPRRCSLSDNNAELIVAFTAVRDEVEQVIGALERHRAQHNEEHFYQVRAIEPDQLVKLSNVERGARLIYLNKTCFNGLYRVNSRGLFNVPMGRYVNPSIFDPDVLRAASAALGPAKLRAAHFSSVLKQARKGDVVYFDPPYVPLSSTAYFTSYTKAAFGENEQRDLAQVYRDLDARGCKLMLSNSDTPVVRDLYRGFDVRKLMARRNINSRGDRRGQVAEVLVLNYAPPG